MPRPLNDRLIVRIHERSTETIAGVIKNQAGTFNDDPFYATVLSTGPEVKQVESGDVVMIGVFAGLNMDRSANTRIASESEIIAIAEEVDFGKLGLELHDSDGAVTCCDLKLLPGYQSRFADDGGAVVGVLADGPNRELEDMLPKISKVKATTGNGVSFWVNHRSMLKGAQVVARAVKAADGSFFKKAA